MRSKSRYVFDTNIVVSALLFSQSKPARAFFTALDEGEVLVSADVVKELNDVLGREKFERYVSEEERTRFLRSLLQAASLIEPEEEIQACRDPKDDKYLEDAVGLTRWLLRKIGRYDELADKELRRYIERALQELQKTRRLEELYRMKYQIRDLIQQNLDAHYLSWAERSYEGLKSTGDLVADRGMAYRVPDEMELPTSQCTTSFQKSVFEFPGKLNAEELEFAGKLDTLDNVACWYRNPDKDGFYLQGYWRAKFNPDFIAFTKSGKVAVLEYKGEDRVTNEDSRYKERLGNDWVALDPEHRYFKMVTKGNMQSTLKEVGAL